MKKVVIGVSTGGLKILAWIFARLPDSISYPVFVVQHVPSDMPDDYLLQLKGKTNTIIKEAYHLEQIASDHIYFAPAGYHLLIENETTMVLSSDPRVNYSRPSIDVLFESAAEIFREQLIGLVLTGANTDGVNGSKCIQRYGGQVYIQDINSAECKIMPLSVQNALGLKPEYCLTPQQIVQLLTNLNKN